jgi:hypothetical protein
MTLVREDNPEPSQDVPIFDDPNIAASGQDIEYLYLTFESEIPLTPVLPPGLEAELPPCPNLRNYDDPFTWSKTRKKLMTYLSCSVNITAAYSAGSYESAAPQLTAKWGVSDVAYNVGITIVSLG